MKYALKLTMVGAALSLVLAACAVPQPAAAPAAPAAEAPKATEAPAAAAPAAGAEFKVGLIFVGPQEDKGWNEAH